MQKSRPTYTQAASTKASLDSLEQIEDELGDTTVTCGDFNAGSRMKNQQGNNPQGKALEEALGDVVFNPVITLLPTRLGSRQGDTGSTTDLALVSPRIAPWPGAETLIPHGNDHLPVVFGLQPHPPPHPPKKKNGQEAKYQAT